MIARRMVKLTARRRSRAARLVALTVAIVVPVGCHLGDPVETVWVTNESATDYVVRLGTEVPRLATADSAGVAYQFPAPWRSQTVVVLTLACDPVATVVNSDSRLALTIKRDGLVSAEQGANLSDLVGGELDRTDLCADL